MRDFTKLSNSRNFRLSAALRVLLPVVSPFVFDGGRSTCTFLSRSFEYTYCQIQERDHTTMNLYLKDKGDESNYNVPGRNRPSHDHGEGEDGDAVEQIAKRNLVEFDDDDDDDEEEEEEEEEEGFYCEDSLLDLDDYCLLVDDLGCEAYENVTTAPNIDALINRVESSETMPKQEEQILKWIRIQARSDQVLGNVQSYQQVWEKIKETQKIQEEYGLTDLYPRHWQSSSSSHSIGESSSKVELSNTTQKHAFSVMQFNILAEGLSSGPNAKTPFSIDPQKKDANNFGGFTQIKHPEIVLDFALRRWRLLQVILGRYPQNGNKETDGDQPKEQYELFDLIAMEEVDRYRGFFKPILRLFGYRGIFVPKPRAPGIRFGWYSDGSALFYKRNTFKLISEKPGEYKVGTQVFLIATLVHRASDKKILVAVTHLKAQQSNTNELIRTAQVSELLERVEEEVASIAATDGGATPHVLILGDFNADPPSVAGPGGCVETVLATERYQSVYPVDPPESGFFTTWKTRGDKTSKRVIDYIFYSNGMQCTHTLSVPDAEEIEKDRCLPSLRHPSDHMSIAAKFELDEGS